MSNFLPKDGAKIYNALKDENLIILAVNVQIIPGVLKGIMQAAKDLDSPIIFELAKSECNLTGGYTGMNPKDFANFCISSAKEIKLENWILHADHLTIKSTKEKDIKEVEKIIKAQIDVGFTSFAIDASFLFNLNAKDEINQLKDNVEVTTKLVNFIKKLYKNDDFGLEVEVGEIGKKNADGLVLTTPKEAIIYLQELSKQNIYPNLLAIANGSSHGNIYKNGKLAPQSSINISQTKEIAKHIQESGYNTKIAQHGITGTPLSIIEKDFPKGDILKGNVGTYWRNIVWDVFKQYEKNLFNEIYLWTIKNYSEDGKTETEIFGKKGKFAIKHFYKQINSISPKTQDILQKQTYLEASKFIKAFNSIGANELLTDE